VDSVHSSLRLMRNLVFRLWITHRISQTTYPGFPEGKKTGES